MKALYRCCYRATMMYLMQGLAQVRLQTCQVRHAWNWWTASSTWTRSRHFSMRLLVRQQTRFLKEEGTIKPRVAGWSWPIGASSRAWTMTILRTAGS